jgi:hypothetical protein
MAGASFDVKKMSAIEFFAAHPEVNANNDRQFLTDVALDGLMNPNTEARHEIVNRLLDWGAYPTVDSYGMGLVAIIVDRVFDPPRDAVLLGRLLDMGADMNRKNGKWGRPFEALLWKFKRSDEELEPLYEQFLSRPGLDLTSRNHSGDTVIDSARKVAKFRASIIPRLEAYLASQEAAEQASGQV